MIGKQKKLIQLIVSLDDVMFSLVMPTLWKGELYKRMLPVLNDHPLIGEIIIIDNDPKNSDFPVLSLSKVKHYPQKQNVYVNPAWNLGVELSKFEKICLYSDDVFFDTKCLELVNETCIPDNGIVGFSMETISENHHSLDFLAPWEQLRVVQTPSMHYRFGICMFMHKQSYYTIPEEYKIYYGDSYIFDQNIFNGKNNFKIDGCPVITSMSTTSKQFNEITEMDTEIYKKNNPSHSMVFEMMEDLKKQLENEL